MKFKQQIMDKCVGYLQGYVQKNAATMEEPSSLINVLFPGVATYDAGRAQALSERKGKEDPSFLIRHPILSQLGANAGGAALGALSGGGIGAAIGGEKGAGIGALVGEGVGLIAAQVAINLAITRKARESFTKEN